jgi:hypothetical protein
VYRTALLLVLASASLCHAQLIRRPFHPAPPPVVVPPPAQAPATSQYFAPTQPAKQDVVLYWCDVTLKAIKAEKTAPPIAARNLAIVHVAIYDAVAAIDQKHEPLQVKERVPAGASIDAAVDAAAYYSLIALYPKQARMLNAAYSAAINRLPTGNAVVDGLALGESVARKVLAWRDGDMAVAKSDYRIKGGLGHWTPTPPEFRQPLLPQWANVRFFALKNADEMHPKAPPELNSEAFVKSYHEVQALGAKNSLVRSADQTQIAHFWADGEGTVTPPGHWNRIASEVAAERKLSTADNARLLAMLNVALADTGIACWDCKFKFDFWRPVTAIREAAALRNPALPPDPRWEPLLTTPPFPSYTSGHSSFSGAAAAVLAAFFGDDKVRFTSTSDALPGVRRSFDSFSSAADEAGMSRIYGGIHYDFDNTAGLDGGKKIGQYIAKNYFKTKG